ncbi:hypothetical protein BEWA_017660 [Theileria equi strain WA]|uniref:Uncharacterized protein n=1 Tax=Theileria equi strain WA TaxID=1537102 RepID=L0ATR1_THEEQ|nr:hypothetical protein BEWA_017660 [Theileria equi strain WA]AFZ78925.1 hypothetical protein BEWA_017660 [Theileria equi strain WA]|eukprot:XP_004828591.1 hypothetical protein BEWA_017660 [Theileria equi strain WA]
MNLTLNEAVYAYNTLIKQGKCLISELTSRGIENEDVTILSSFDYQYYYYYLFHYFYSLHRPYQQVTIEGNRIEDKRGSSIITSNKDYYKVFMDIPQVDDFHIVIPRECCLVPIQVTIYRDPTLSKYQDSVMVKFMWNMIDSRSIDVMSQILCRDYGVPFDENITKDIRRQVVDAFIVESDFAILVEYIIFKLKVTTQLHQDFIKPIVINVAVYEDIRISETISWNLFNSDWEIVEIVKTIVIDNDIDCTLTNTILHQFKSQILSHKRAILEQYSSILLSYTEENGLRIPFICRDKEEKCDENRPFINFQRKFCPQDILNAHKSSHKERLELNCKYREDNDSEDEPNYTRTEIHTLDDIRYLTDFLLKDTHFVLNNILKSAINGDDSIVNDLVYLIEFNVQESSSESRKKCQSIFDSIVYESLTSDSNKTCYTLIKRLYIRGFSKELAYSIINYYESFVIIDRRLQKNEVTTSRIGYHKTTLYLCSNVLRSLSDLLGVENTSDGLKLYIDSNKSYNVIINIIALLMNSFININNSWNIDALFELFHPFGISFVPGPISFLIIDYIPYEQKLKLLHKLSIYWSDFQLIARLNSKGDIFLTSYICRLLVKSRGCEHNKERVDYITKYFLFGINKRLGSANKIERCCGMAVAELLSHFLNDTNLGLNGNDELTFDEFYEYSCTELWLLYAAKLDILIKSSHDNNVATAPKRPYFQELNDKSVYYQKNNGNINTGGKSDIDKQVDVLFAGVPRMNSETIEDSINEVWITPPQHILQCYERLLSRPARGDVDFESVLSYDLSKVNDDTLKNKALAISQTLLYLPHIVEKDESILKKLAVPISDLLIKLDNLQIYKDAIEKVSKNLLANHKKLVSEENILIEFDHSVQTSHYPNFISYDPEHLIFAGLVSIIYKYPLNMIKHFSTQLFNSEFTLTQKVTMILSIQYASIGLSRSMDIRDVCNEFISKREQNKFVTDSKSALVNKPEISVIPSLSTESPLCTNDDFYVEPREVIHPRNGATSGSKMIKPNTNKLNAISSSAVSCFLYTLQSYMNVNAERERSTNVWNSDETIVIGIIETLIIFLNNSYKSISNEALKQCSDVVCYCFQVSTDRTVLKLLEVLGSAILEYNNR